MAGKNKAEQGREIVDSKKSAAVAASKKETATSSTGEDNIKRRVQQAILHSPMFFNGWQHENLSGAKVPGIQMLWVRFEGLLISHHGKECLVPHAAVKQVIFEQKNSGRVVAD